ncbi:uncharacterized protein LOC124498713 [Dermatophagoides farinae]|uniref:uncharacterized protein LOC124498713 n=1 Tax=Dermatophagoides farinae TaxID=6954 RepID=UPI003F6042A4
MCENLCLSIINLYINVLGIDVGEQFLQMMSKEMLNDRLILLENLEKQTNKLRSMLGEQMAITDHDHLLFMNDYSIKLDQISSCLIRLFNETYSEYEKECSIENDATGNNGNNQNNYDNDDDDDEENIDQSPKTTTIQKEKYEIKIDFQYEDLFIEQEILDFEWKKWFRFDDEMCVKLRIYCRDRFDDELPLQMRIELKEILATLNDSTKETLIERIKKFTMMIQTIQELWYLVEIVHETIMKNGCHDYYIWLCKLLINSITIIHENLMGIDVFYFQHLFSTKCRIIFFDFQHEGIYKGFSDSIRLNNAELITKLCKSDSLPSNLLLICLKYLLMLQQKNHIECFVQMFQWYGFESFKELVIKNLSNHGRPLKYIRSIFIDLDRLIIESQSSTSNNQQQLSSETISLMKRISSCEFKKKFT